MDTTNQQIIKKMSIYWWILFSVFLLVGQRLVGIGGAVGGSIIVFGLYKTIKNPSYSNTKKIMYSILYSIVGIFIAGIIAVGSALVLQKFFGPNILSKPNIEQNYTIPDGFKSYKNQYMELSAIAYPDSWTVSEGKDKYEIFFESPDKKAVITTTLFSFNNDQKINYQTFASEQVAGMKSYPNIQFSKTYEQIKKINGKDWLVFDGILGINNRTFYNRYAIFITGKYDNSQFIQFVLESDKDSFSTDSIIFDKIIESARFY